MVMRLAFFVTSYYSETLLGPRLTMSVVQSENGHCAQDYFSEDYFSLVNEAPMEVLLTKTILHFLVRHRRQKSANSEA